MKLNVNCTKIIFHQLWLPEASIWRCEDPASQWLQWRKLNQNFPHTDQFKVESSTSCTVSITESSRNSVQTLAKFDFTLQRHRTVMKLNWKEGGSLEKSLFIIFLDWERRSGEGIEGFGPNLNKTSLSLKTQTHYLNVNYIMHFL